MGTFLCAAASLLLLISSIYLYTAGSGGWGFVLLVGLGLLFAAAKSFGRRR
jgi:hypothetical protein